MGNPYRPDMPPGWAEASGTAAPRLELDERGAGSRVWRTRLPAPLEALSDARAAALVDFGELAAQLGRVPGSTFLGIRGSRRGDGVGRLDVATRWRTATNALRAAGPARFTDRRAGSSRYLVRSIAVDRVALAWWAVVDLDGRAALARRATGGSGRAAVEAVIAELGTTADVLARVFRESR